MSTVMSDKKRALFIFNVLSHLFPNAKTELHHNSPFQLLIATILSAQCTDERVNKVTPALFEQFPTPLAFSEASLSAIKEAIKSINFFNNKALNIQKTAHILRDQNGIPETLEGLTALPGVGRKTANVVLGQAFGVPGITVDTHVKRLSNRLGFTTESDPEKIESDLMTLWAPSMWIEFSTVLILHGRATCKARKPQCTGCPIRHYCPYPSR